MAKKANKPIGIVVRRGALRRFAALTRKTAKLPVAVLWDRRVTDREASPELDRMNNRTANRRRKPPYTWEVADFVVVDTAPYQGQPARPHVARAELKLVASITGQKKTT